MKRRVLRTTLLTMFVTLAAGCYSYRPLRIQALEAGQTVRVYVSSERSAQLEDELGVRDRELIGDVVEAGPSEVLLEIPVSSVTAGGRQRRLHQRVRIPSSDLLETEERTLNSWKTALATGGVVAVVGGLFVYTVIEGDSSPTENPKDQPDQLRIPLLRIPLP